MKINILGYGVMGKQIAALFYAGGYNVKIWDYIKINLDDLNMEIKKVRKAFGLQKIGNLSCIGRIADIENHPTIEALVEDLGVKRKVYDSVKNNITGYYYSNTSSYAPNEIGRGVSALHFFNPISMSIAEYYLADGKKSNSLLEFLQSIGFDLIEVRNNRGYIGNYILFNEISTAMKLIEKNKYRAEDINKIYAKLYPGRNIFKIMDVIGLDVVCKILLNLKEKDSGIYISQFLKNAVEQNILGRKNKTSIMEVIK
jgi:3-hydroxyacyl-CoA dehydrogenase